MTTRRQAQQREKKSLEIAPFLIRILRRLACARLPVSGDDRKSARKSARARASGKTLFQTSAFFRFPALSIVCTDRDPGIGYLTIIRRRLSEYCRIIPETNRRRIIEPEENNCFSIIAQVIIRATAFSFILLVSSL